MMLERKSWYYGANDLADGFNVIYTAYVPEVPYHQKYLCHGDT